MYPPAGFMRGRIQPGIAQRVMSRMLSPEQKIIDVLQDHNSTHPLRRENLLTRLHDAGFSLSDRKMREMVARMVVDGHQTIGTNDRGYFYIHNEQDLREAQKELDEKAQSIAVRKNCLIRNYNEREPHGDSIFHSDTDGQLRFA